MKLDEILDPKLFADRLQQSPNERPDRIRKLIAMLRARAQKNNPKRNDLRGAEEDTNDLIPGAEMKGEFSGLF